MNPPAPPAVWPAGNFKQVSITIAPDPAPPSDAAADRRWAELLAEKPRLFDGPILSVQSLALDRGLISCRRDTYKRLAVQPEVPTGANLLSVSGVLTALDSRGREHTLLGRRGRQTRIYGNMWELAPSGGVDAPPPGQRQVSWHGLMAQLQAELLSETGLADTLQNAEFLAAVRDPVAFSTDLVIRARLSPTIDRLKPARTNWEYSELLWLPLADLPRVAASEPTIATTRALIPLLG